jgi:hypothetical protein
MPTLNITLIYRPTTLSLQTLNMAKPLPWPGPRNSRETAIIRHEIVIVVDSCNQIPEVGEMTHVELER